MTFYRQCTLELDGCGVAATSQQVAWIPEQFAIRCKYLKVKGENGWKVLDVGSHSQSEDYIEDHERDFLGHRKRTDV